MSNSLSETAYDEILKRILRGDYAQGQLLTEDKLCKDLNMSRTPVREALKMLESEGIVKKMNRSYAVIYITSEEVEKLYEVRIPLESAASRLAAVRAKQEDIAEMEEILNKVKEETYKENPDPSRLAELNGQFHDRVAMATENPFMYSYLREIRLKLRVVRITLFTSFDRRVEELREHQGILDAIKARDAERAYEMMISHENNVLEYLKAKVIPILLTRR
ncbi:MULTISPECIES: GntR family transcriptional regulator [Metallosphaera]|uniref:GntR family transcriptional regulator n=1 Tax=Metallosphaera TaxID=41980 RepID=UPI001F063120|nr:GntR family transcriptional regulator [Metallosphaera sedula]MCH1772182.1 GntR family transcriptional regulator [Metallosphaera sedula]MCP6727728.1 GntR family transcriptional regulator [Metallosphaera sedula]